MTPSVRSAAVALCIATFRLTWGPAAAAPLMVTSFKVYAALSTAPAGGSAIVFEQALPAGLTGCANGDVASVVASFPALSPHTPGQLAEPQLAFLAFTGLSGVSHVAQWTSEGLGQNYLAATVARQWLRS